MRLEKLVFDTIDTSSAIGEDSRLIMCVGPSGAGKTTTLAKWAAKAHLQEGKRVAIVTLDAFRAGAVAQVRRYADLIGCPLSVAEDMATLQLALDKHADKELIFVDTAGRDPSAQAELEAVSNALRARDRNAEIHLALPAMFGPRSMRATLDTYKRLGANRLCFTKIDEVIDFAPVALIGASAGLPLSYWTTGQRIPDDVERISAQGFAERTLQALTSSLFGAQLHVEERFL
jgi:flagellar biosynthesis protein FlhF